MIHEDVDLVKAKFKEVHRAELGEIRFRGREGMFRVYFVEAAGSYPRAIDFAYVNGERVSFRFSTTANRFAAPQAP